MLGGRRPCTQRGIHSPAAAQEEVISLNDLPFIPLSRPPTYLSILRTLTTEEAECSRGHLFGRGGGTNKGERGKSFLPFLSLCRVVMHFCFGRGNRRKATKGAISLPRSRRRQQNSPICNLGTASSVRWVLSPFCRKGRRWAALTCRTDVALWRRRREKTGESFFSLLRKRKGNEKGERPDLVS